MSIKKGLERGIQNDYIRQIKTNQNESNIVLRSKRLFCLQRNEIKKQTQYDMTVHRQKMNKIFQTMKIKEVNKTILFRSLKT